MATINHTIEVAGLHVTGQPALNAVQIEIVDPRGRAVAFLIGPDQVIGLAVLLIHAHKRLVRAGRS